MTALLTFINELACEQAPKGWLTSTSGLEGKGANEVAWRTVIAFDEWVSRHTCAHGAYLKQLGWLR